MRRKLPTVGPGPALVTRGAVVRDGGDARGAVHDLLPIWRVAQYRARELAARATVTRWRRRALLWRRMSRLGDGESSGAGNLGHLKTGNS